MKLNLFAGAALAAALLAGAPAAAQKPGDPGRGRVADEIAREIRDAADAIGTVTEAVDESLGRVRYRGAERFAIDRCADRLGKRIDVDHVAPYGRRSLRVTGTVDGGDRYRGYGRPRAFACTVRDDGRVRLRTRRLA
jgi:hypothetical protein